MSETFEVVATGAAADAIGTHVPTLVEDGFAGKLFAKDPSLWGQDAVEEAGKRLSWVTLPQSSRPLVGEVAALRSELVEAGVDHVVLCGKSGSTVETDSQRRAYEQAFTDAGIDPAARIVIVTDPGSPLEKESRPGP